MQPDIEAKYLAAYDEWADALYRHCFFRVYSKERAEELVQDTFMKTWVYLSQGNEVANLKAFLYKVANNLVIDNSRKKKEQSLEALMEDSNAHEPSYEGHKEIENSVMFGQVMEVMKELPDNYRELLIMRYVDDLHPREIAEVLGVKPNNISVTLNRAVAALKEKANIDIDIMLDKNIEN